MSWVKSGENLYTHDQAPFIIENLNGSWGIRDTRDKTSFIPFSDIFNNPVFPIDLSNVDVIVKTLNSIGAIIGNSLTAIGIIAGDSLSIVNTSLSKHFRGEANNTPSTPAFSFQGDIDTGFYRISEDRIGFSANGIRQGEFGVGYGGFTGNIIQVVNSENDYTHSILTSANWNSDILSAVGVSWETLLTPRYNNSKVIISLNLSATISGSSQTIFGISIWRKIGAGAYTQIQIPITDVNGSYEFGLGVAGAIYGGFNKLFIDSPATDQIVRYKFSGRLYGSGGTLAINNSATPTKGKSFCLLQEVQQ